MDWQDKFIGTATGTIVGGVVTMAVTGAAAVSAPVVGGAVAVGGVTYGAIKMGEALFNLSKKGYDAITMNKGAVTAFQNDMKNSQPFIDVDFDAQLLEEIQQAVTDMGDKAILMINTKTRESGLIDKDELKKNEKLMDTQYWKYTGITKTNSCTLCLTLKAKLTVSLRRKPISKRLLKYMILIMVKPTLSL